MAFNPNQFQASFTGSGSALPLDWYLVQFTGSEIKENNNGTGAYVALTLTVVQGEYANQTQVDRLNLWNSSQAAVDIAMKRLAAYCYVCGVQGLNDEREPVELYGKPFWAHIGPQKNDAKYSEVKEIKNQQGQEPAAIQAAMMGGQAPANAAPQGFAPATQQQPQTQQQGWGQQPTGGTPAVQQQQPATSWGQQPQTQQAQQPQSNGWGQGQQQQQPQTQQQAAPAANRPAWAK